MLKILSLERQVNGFPFNSTQRLKGLRVRGFITSRLVLQGTCPFIQLSDGDLRALQQGRLILELEVTPWQDS